MNKRRKFIKDIGRVCGFFRKRILHMTLKQMSDKRGVPVSSLNNFEHGRSSSLQLFYEYLVSCETDQELGIFIISVNKVFKDEYAKEVHK